MDLPLHTARLRLDRLTAADAGPLAAYRSDPAVARFQSWATPYPLEAAAALVTEAASVPIGTPGHHGQLAIRRAADGELLGDVYLHVLAGSPHAAELGVTLATAHQGHGYATEAVGGVLDAVVGPIVHKVIAYVDVRNTGSLALFDRLGFHREGRLADSFQLPDGSFADEILFGTTAPQRREAQLARPAGRQVQET